MRQFVAYDAARYSLNVGQQIIHGLYLAFAASHGELRAGALDQVVEIFLRVAQGFAVRFFSFAADVEIGVEALVKGENFDGEFLFH